MGVTTLIAGEGGTPVAADKIATYFAQLERQGIAVNFGTSYSAAQARIKIMGDAAGVPTEDQMRDESSKLLDGISEAIAIGERSGAKVEIYHLKAAYAPQWGKLMPQAVAMIEAARARGVDIAADMYP